MSKARIQQIVGIIVSCLVIGVPLRAGITIFGELSHEKEAIPGQTYTGTIYVKNDGDDLEEVKIFQTDYFFYSNGTTEYGDAGTLERSNAIWIEFSPSRLSVPPQGQMAVTYRITVPEDQSLFGTYWSMLMVEPIPKNSPENPLSQNTVGINTVIRYGIQMVTNIKGTGEPNLQFQDVKLLRGESGPYLQVDIINKGTLLTRPKVWVDLVDSNAKAVGRRESREMRIYPETSVRYRIDLSSVRAGNYQALVVADGGENAMVGSRYNLNIIQ